MTSTTRPATRGKRKGVGRSRWGAARVAVGRNASRAGAIMTKTGLRLSLGRRQGAVVIQATRDFTVQTVQKAADLAVQAGSRLYTDSASSYRALQGDVYVFVNHTKKEYARGSA